MQNFIRLSKEMKRSRWLLTAILTLLVILLVFLIGNSSSPTESEPEDTIPSFVSNKQHEKNLISLLSSTTQTDDYPKDSSIYQNLKNSILDELRRTVDQTKQKNVNNDTYHDIDYNHLKALIINDLRSIIVPDWEQIQKKKQESLLNQGNSNNPNEPIDANELVQLKHEIQKVKNLEKLIDSQMHWIAETQGDIKTLKEINITKESLAGIPEIRRLISLKIKANFLQKYAREQLELIGKLNSDVKYSHYQLSHLRNYFREQTKKSRGPLQAKIPKEKRQLIFSLNAGRSGSGYLARLLQTSPNVLSFHERKPKMSGIPLRLAKEYGLNETMSERMAKAYSIERDLDENPGMIYVETSHLFLLNFYDVVLQYFPPEHYEIRVIALRRYLADVVQSLLGLSFPTSQSYWYYNLKDKIATLPYLKDPKDEWDMALEYILDFEAKIKWFRKTYPHIQVIDARLEELQTIQGVRKLFDALGFQCTDQTENYIKTSFSTTIIKFDSGPSEMEKEIEQRIIDFYRLYKSNGFSVDVLPDLVNLNQIHSNPPPQSTKNYQEYQDDDEEVTLIRNSDNFLTFWKNSKINQIF